MDPASTSGKWKFDCASGLTFDCTMDGTSSNRT
jgi:hypothetical protein